jgi:hypothetical protein
MIEGINQSGDTSGLMPSIIRPENKTEDSSVPLSRHFRLFFHVEAARGERDASVQSRTVMQCAVDQLSNQARGWTLLLVVCRLVAVLLCIATFLP